MGAKERRQYIENLLINSETPKKGQDIAEKLHVTRQVIVKDIAILRAQGLNIIATPEGYLMPKVEEKNICKILPLSHNREDIGDELECIVKYGGIVKDVIVEHPLYGEIKAMLMIKTLYDIQSFVKKVKEYNAKPLLALTRGIHLHTIEVDEEENMNKIIKELKDKGYLIEEY
ncbi:transcription repressor NadR [Clostridium ganghwense]|uniref:Transcription repressor NadR n=1 Tax=Clostridium ganghwense TaxID=312089 RepID=A0ABT4CUK8_9CLOT|nr:transcription repressor NadR [Clostridium ganghwense]